MVGRDGGGRGIEVEVVVVKNHYVELQYGLARHVTIPDLSGIKVDQSTTGYSFWVLSYRSEPTGSMIIQSTSYPLLYRVASLK